MSLEIILDCNLAEYDGHEWHEVEVESQIEEVEDFVDNSYHLMLF